jgi:hypothetical protein
LAPAYHDRVCTHSVEASDQCPEILIGKAANQGVYIVTICSPAEIGSERILTGLYGLAFEIITVVMVASRKLMGCGSLLSQRSATLSSWGFFGLEDTLSKFSIGSIGIMLPYGRCSAAVSKDVAWLRSHGNDPVVQKRRASEDSW